MKSPHVAVSLGFIFILGVSAPARFTIDAMQHTVSLAHAAISPDGSQIAYVESRKDLEHNTSTDALQLFDRRTHSVRALAPAHKSVDEVAWSPDGTQLATVVDVAKEDASQIVLIDPKTGAERQLTSGSASPSSIAWSPDGASIAFRRSDVRPKKTGAESFRDGFEVTDNAYLATGPTNAAQIWIASVVGGEHQVTSGARHVANAPLSWSADGKMLLYERAASAIYGLQDRATAMRVDITTGINVPATAHSNYEDQALYSPDGTHIAYLYSRNGQPANATDSIVDNRDLSLQLDHHVSVLAWMPDSRSVLLRVYDRTQTPLFIQHLDGSAERVPLGPVLAASIDAQGNVAKDGTIAFVGSEARRPDELYVLAPGAEQPERLTSVNDAIASLDLGRAERIAWTSGKFEEDGVLTYPPGYVAGRKYPLVLRIHGGPTESSPTSFSDFYQLAAAHGYLVFAPNYRGSNDLGNAYEHAILNDASAGPGEDVLAGIRAVERLGIVDSTRIAVSGWSYGGQLTSWMEGHYHFWRAAVAGAAVNDLVLDYAIADDIDADAVGFTGGSPFKGNALATWRKQSPITYFKDIRTPTLIFCNVYDVRVPIPESYEMYHALRDNDVEVKFIAYPSTGHLPKGPVRLGDVYKKWLAWFDQHLK